jgi:F0F1-type ATP synthase delta subunit
MDTIDRPPQTGDKGGHPKPALEDKLIESRASTCTARTYWTWKGHPIALRLLEMVLPEKDGDDVRALLEGCKVLDHRQIRLADGEVLVRILLDAEQSEAVLDLLEKRYSGEGNRVVILPVDATLKGLRSIKGISRS